MDELTLQAITAEINELLTGGQWGRVWQTGRAAFIFEVKTDITRLLFVCVEPSAPRLYVVERRVREVERAARPPQGLALLLRKQLDGARLEEIAKDPSDRVVYFRLTGRDEIGAVYRRALVAQLTGRAANLLLLDDKGHIIDALRPLQGAGQETGALYAPPVSQTPPTPKPPAFTQGDCATLSQAADFHYTRLEAERAFAARATAARQKLQKEITQREKMQARLRQDLARHGDPSIHKWRGDTLLANLTTAQRDGATVTLTDYFADDAPQIELEVEAHLTLQEAANRAFARYAKAKRTAQEVARRLAQLEQELKDLHAQRDALEADIAQGVVQAESAPNHDAKAKKENTIPGTRRYLSADGYEILVGRSSRHNDNLTFRVARPHDWWLHAADYPGSHVVVRNPARGDIPQRTLYEAAQLAAQHSQAKNLPKADVRYTQRKFLSKPKGAAPGLVRLSSYKTLTVNTIKDA